MNELEAAYRSIQPKIYAFFYVKTSNCAIAEDLTHDVFYAACKGYTSFAGNSSLETWLFSIAQNTLKKYYRSKRYSESLNEKLTKETTQPTQSPEDILLMNENKANLLGKIEYLDDLQKEIVTLRLYGELSFKEIGELVNKSENYVRVTFHRIKLKLQKELEAKK